MCLNRALSILSRLARWLWPLTRKSGSSTKPVAPNATVRQLERSALVLFPHQAGGHGQILVAERGSICKPVLSGQKGQVEQRFYIELQSRDFGGLRNFVPKFHGIVRIGDSSGSAEHIQMEDVTSGFLLPCIVDLKMGRITYDPNASVDKRARESSKYPWQHELGFRVTGMRVFDHRTESYRVFDKHYGRKLSAENIASAFHAYLDTGVDAPLHPDLLPSLRKRLVEILAWFERQRELHFFASSLLIVYEGQPTLLDSLSTREQTESSTSSLTSPNASPVRRQPRRLPSSDSPSSANANAAANASVQMQPAEVKRTRSELTVPSPRAVAESRATANSTHNARFATRTGARVSVHMIDFGHVFRAPDKSADEGYMHGLRSLLRIVDQLQTQTQLASSGASDNAVL